MLSINHHKESLIVRPPVLTVSLKGEGNSVYTVFPMVWVGKPGNRLWTVPVIINNIVYIKKKQMVRLIVNLLFFIN